MDVEKILSRLVRIGTVTMADPVNRVARVKFEDSGQSSGLLYVLANRPYVPDYDVPQKTEKRAGGSGDAAFEDHDHDLKIKPWMPRVNAVVLTVYLPILDGDGFILGEIGALGKLKQWEDQ